MKWLTNFLILRNKSAMPRNMSGFLFRINLTGACFTFILAVLLTTTFVDYFRNGVWNYFMSNSLEIAFSITITLLIFQKKRPGIYLCFYYSFYLGYEIINSSLKVNAIKLPQILIVMMVILSIFNLFPIIIRDWNYKIPADIEEDEQKILLEFFFFFMLLGVIGFCLLLLQR